MNTMMVVLVAVLLAACGGKQPGAKSGGDAQSGDIAKQLEALDNRLAKIETFLGESLDPPPEPDPNAVYAVPIADYPFEGAEHAKITIVKAFEFACGYCYQVRPTIEQLLQDYKGDIKIVYMNFIVHPDTAVVPGLASCAAYKQGKFAEMKTLIWDKGFAEEDLGEEKMSELAKEAGLDMAKYSADLKGDTCTQWLSEGHRRFAELGVRGTPAFYVNGRFLSGAQSVDVFKTLIDEELVKANKAIASGTTIAAYYQTHVLANGKVKLDAESE